MLLSPALTHKIVGVAKRYALEERTRLAKLDDEGRPKDGTTARQTEPREEHKPITRVGEG